MIPTLPGEMSDRAMLKFYDTLSGNLSDQSTIHTNWHTHRGNPSVCWICDLVTLLSMVITLAFEINTKSAVDIEIDASQDETDSVPEIEDNLNVDEEPGMTPEYDVEDCEVSEE